jgi:2-phospho-L-lactate guanylyltransferase
MNAVWALVPVKSPAHAKSRLAPALSAAERAALAGHMARDVLAALRAAPSLTGIALLTADAAGHALATEFGCREFPEDAQRDLCANLDAAAAALAAEGANAVIIVPTDLPTLAADDVQALIASLEQGVTIAPASMDGGTNALAMAPPGAGPCLFGADSARRHLDAARRRGVAARRLELPAFARDVDSVDDVLWLCGQESGGNARRYLDHSGICARLRAAARGGVTGT